LESEESNKNQGTQRTGKICLFKINAEEDSLQLVQEIKTEAILDQKWLDDQLFVATSCGKIQQFQMEPENGKLVRKSQINLDSDGTAKLALSLDIHSQNQQILVSDSLGGLSTVDMEKMTVTNFWDSHGFEAWTCAFDQFNENICYSGGDDCFLNIHDLRTTDSKFKIQNKSHEAGVTSLLNPRENVLITGSYDEKIRVFDTRKFKVPMGEESLGGGIWRIKQDPHKETLLLTALMYKNFTFLDFQGDCFRILEEFNEHKSICYGCDFSRMESKNGWVYFATCSFYDHKLCFGKVDLQKK
jgi:diphthamide biosynthesis protein 7